MRADLPDNFSLQWLLTERCNLSCAHCYQGGAPVPDPGPDRLLRIFSEILSLLRHFGLPREKVKLRLSGGEPFLRKDLFALLKGIAGYSHLYKWAILSNGSLLTAAAVKRLRKLGVDEYHLSLEGLRENNDAVRGRGTFDRTVAAIKLLRAAGIPVWAALTLTRRNAADIAPLADLLDGLGVEEFDVRRLVPAGRGKGLLGGMLTPGELLNYYRAAKKINARLARKGRKLRIRFGCDSGLFGGELAKDPLAAGPLRSCGLVRGTGLAIMANGDVAGCRRLPLVLGNCLKTGLRDLYYSKQMREFQDTKKIAPFCRKCQNYINCFGGAKCVTYAYSGKLDIPDVQCWKAGGAGGLPPH